MLVRQEESPDTATNSETFLLLMSCSYSFDPGILPNMTLLLGVRGSPKIPTGSVQESQPVFVLRPFIVSFEVEQRLNVKKNLLQNAKVSPHLTSLQTRKTPSSLSYSDRQPGVLLI